MRKASNNCKRLKIGCRLVNVNNGSNMHASLKVVAICSYYVHFSCNTLSWLKLCIFQPKKLSFSWDARVAFEMVGVWLD